MQPKPPEGPEDIARQLALHIDSLRGAGVEWAPGALPADATPSRPTPGAVKPVSPNAPAPLPVLQTVIVAGAPIPEASPGSVGSRLQQLEALRRQVAECVRCPQLAATRTQTVFGVGPLDPDLCFVG